MIDKMDIVIIIMMGTIVAGLVGNSSVSIVCGIAVFYMLLE